MERLKGATLEEKLPQFRGERLAHREENSVGITFFLCHYDCQAGQLFTSTYER